MYEIVKRRGSFFEPIPEAPTFEDKAEAERWAASFIETNPNRFQRGLEAIEVRRKIDTLNEKLRQVDA
jgi:hypothetical protein